MILKWTSLALEDCEFIFDFIRQDSLRAAKATDKRTETQVERLLSFPLSGRRGHTVGTCELVISRTPYIVAYKVSGNTIHILRVVHGAQEWPQEIARNL